MEDLDTSKIDTSFKLAEGVIQETPVDEQTKATEDILAEELLANFLGGPKLEKTLLSVEAAKPLFYTHLLEKFAAFPNSHCLVLDIGGANNTFKLIIFRERPTIKFISSIGESTYQFTLEQTGNIKDIKPSKFDPNSLFTNFELWNGKDRIPGLKGRKGKIVYRDHFHNPNSNSIQGCAADLVKTLIQEKKVTPPDYATMISQGLFDPHMIQYIEGVVGQEQIKAYYTKNRKYVIELQGANLDYENSFVKTYLTKELLAGFFTLTENGRPQIKDLFVGDETRLTMLHEKIALVGVGRFMNLWSTKEFVRRDIIGAIQYPLTYTELEFTTLVEDLFKETKE